MAKLIMTRGLPASGKSTWAKEQITECNGTTVRVNKDDLRAMLHGGKWSKDREKITLSVRNAIIVDALEYGKSVIVDDTNFAPQHEQTLRDTASVMGAEFEIQDFTHVPLATCLERDADRTVGRVGRKVIVEMWEKYLYKKPVPPTYIPGVPDAIICDLDGTVAVMINRGPFDANVENDLPRKHVIAAINALAPPDVGPVLIFVSGRKEEARNGTNTWLHGNVRTSFEALYMRANDDNRRDSIVKREIYDTHIAGKYNVVAVFDDRPQVIRECWRPLGLPVFDVGDGREF